MYIFKVYLERSNLQQKYRSKPTERVNGLRFSAVERFETEAKRSFARRYKENQFLRLIKTAEKLQI